MAEKPKSKLELVVELIKAAAWPVFAAILLITFWSPLRETAKEVPSLVGRSDSVTIAGLSLKVSRGLRQKASPQVKRVLAELSTENVERVLSMSSSSWWDEGSESAARADYAALIQLGVVEEIPSDVVEERNREDGRNFGFAVRPTELGRETQSFLRAVVAEFVRELEFSEAEDSDD